MGIFYFHFSRQAFSVALEPVLELALVDQFGLRLTEIHLPLPPHAGNKGVCHHCLVSMGFCCGGLYVHVDRPILKHDELQSYI